VIEVKDLWFKYGREYVLKGISFRFYNRILVIIGPNGSGKTTLLKCIGGLLKPTLGKVIVDGKDYWSISESERLVLRRSIIYVHEKPYLFRGSVLQNIEYPLKIRGVSSSERSKRIRFAAKLLEIEYLLNKKSSELSAGEARLVALARALAAEPKYLLLDEPLANLDQSRVSLVLKVLKEVSIRTRLIIASHRQQVLSLAEEVFVLEDGKLGKLSNDYCLV